MPHPSRSQSSSNLRQCTSQRLDTCIPLNSKPMLNPEPLLSNASLRRLSSSRRACPSATAIADIFVRSLVVASYCHKHSPRGRGMATMSINNLKRNGVRGECRSMARTTKQLVSKTQLDYLGSRAESLVTPPLGAQRMFNSSVAQKTDEYPREEVRITPSPTKEQSHRTHNTELNHSKHFNEEYRPLSHKKLKFDLEMVSFFSADQPKYDSIDYLEQSSVRHHRKEAHNLEGFRHYTSPRAELYAYSSKLYQAALGTSLDWELAANAIKTPRVFPTQRDTTRNSVELQSVQRFLEAMWDTSKSNYYVFSLYRDLPHPGVSCLSKRTRGALLRRFAHPRDRRWVDARRYLALVDDMLTADLPISRSLWTTAIHLAGRATGKVSKQDLVRAIGLWQQMEHIAGVKSDGVVFGVLFDIAIKAGQFTVADRLMGEMENRRIQFDRAGKVSKMYYYGLRRDPEGIRRTFNEFVAAGEIVDTAVLNCLIVSFFRAGEPKLGEQLYQGMMQTQTASQKTSLSDTSQQDLHYPGFAGDLVVYRKRARKLNRFLQLSASLKDNLPEHHQALQDAFPMAPDTRTFHILLSYHAYHSGNLDAFTSVLADMERVFAIPPRGMIYLLLFEGFAHQGRKKKAWTAEKLWSAWKAYLRALYESKTRLSSRSYSLPSTFVWENPLGTSPVCGPANSAASQGSTPSELYTPLPSTLANVKDEPVNNFPEDEDNAKPHADDDTSELDIYGTLSQGKRDHLEQDELEAMERRIENGVFLGRRMIMIILRAFSACCGRNDVMEVWLRMESIWQPEKRKGLDVLAVKEELEKQMNRAR